MMPSHLSQRLRRALAPVRRRRMGSPAAASTSSGNDRAPGGRDYATWIDLYDAPTSGSLAELRHRLRLLDRRPSISLVMPVFNSPPDLLQQAIASVRGQLYEEWELCIADDGSVGDAVPELIGRATSEDQRIRAVRLPRNAGIAAASNAALALATGEWVAPVDHDDELAPHALAHIALAVADNPEVAVVYTDEDKIDAEGRRSLAYFKPDFDPVLLLGQNYLAHLIAYRLDLVRRVGGYREQFDGSQDWDLTLRVTELVSSGQVVHIPRVLYHWRSHPGSTATGAQAKPQAVTAGHAAVSDHLSRQEAGGRVDTDPGTGWHRVLWPLPEPAPHVDIVAVNADGRCLPAWVEGFRERTAYPGYDVTIVTPGGDETGREAVNRAVADSCGTVICLISGRCDITASDWLRELVGQLLRDGVGVVGGRILRPDGTVGSAGKALDLDDVAVDLREPSEPDAVNDGRFQLAHRVSAVSDDLMAVRRSAWQQVAGFDTEHLPTVFGDVDLCLRLGAAGWHTVWTPHATAVLRPGAEPQDGGAPLSEVSTAVGYMRLRWGRELRRDPAMNPNLRATRHGVGLAFPPRV